MTAHLTHLANCAQHYRTTYAAHAPLSPQPVPTRTPEPIAQAKPARTRKIQNRSCFH
ncbi:MAG: hypothetical protein IPL33_12890 [Sphingobacteriales bacterium]|nr:hypothetical protein [Sphingobacteriales bacterium]